MGKLLNGEWNKEPIIKNKNGSFKREDRSFRNWISDSSKFKPEKNRYHLYVSFACPWAHRTLIMRSLKNLEDIIDVSVVHPKMLENGWSFSDDFTNCNGDLLYNLDFLHQLYQKAEDNLSCSVTVPVLWDKKENTIVNNESSEIIRIFNESFNEFTKNKDNYYPLKLRDEIDIINEEIYHNINNGVYKAGFATTQEAYEKSVSNLFRTLDKIENRLHHKEFLINNELTEADIRLVTTLLRFDLVYHFHFKCNIKRIADYPNLSKYLKKMYSINAIKSTTFFDHIKTHYYFSHEQINPYRIIPLGPSDIL